MRTILNILVWVSLVVLLVVTLGFVEKQKTAQLCNGVKINIDRTDNNYFVEETDVQHLIENMGYDIDSSYIKEYNISQIERLLNNNPSIKNAEVYSTIDGYLKVDIIQRKPLLRIFTNKQQSYYIDSEGWLMPLSNKYTSNIIIANGEIFEQYSSNYQVNVNDLEENHILRQLYDISTFATNNDFWNSQIVQIYVNEKNDVELIPRVGNHNIIIGDANNLKEKMDKLMIFYKKGLSKTGWNEYTTINLKYKNQVVCTKR